MKWLHECSIEWLQERKQYITASDIVAMLPVTPTGREKPQDKIEEAMWNVWAEKQTLIIEDDCISTGAAARGHLLEPYAVEEFNELAMRRYSPKFYHWDDCLIRNKNSRLAFSPDALSIETLKGVCIKEELLKSFEGMEIKSYAAAKHYLKGRSDKKSLEERWQIATAFAVSDKLTWMYLVFYNPKCKHHLFVKVFSRSMLRQEIRTVKKTYEDYMAFTKTIEATAHALSSGKNLKAMNEIEIIEEIHAAQELEKGILNPR